MTESRKMGPLRKFIETEICVSSGQLFKKKDKLQTWSSLKEIFN